MPRLQKVVLGIVIVVFLVDVGLSWGGPPNNDVSDAQGNTASGSGALFSNSTGTNNTASGVNALFSNSTGANNTASGVNALVFNSTGTNNTASGVNALFLNTIGNGNIAVGAGAGGNLTNGDNNIYLGNPGQVAESGIIRLGTSGVHTQTFLAGDVFATSFIPSDIRLKSHVTPLTHVLEKLAQLRGVSFEWNEAAAPLTGRTPGQRDIGVIAQEIEALFPELITTWGTEGYKAVAYEKLTGVLLVAVKELKALTDTQQQQLSAQGQQMTMQVAELTAQNARLRAAVVQQQERDAALAARLERLEAAAARAAALASR
jgi:Chaperone of endosialidase